MDRVREIPLSRIFVEGTVIVLSILLAFWIDAWWEDRQQRKDETVLLQALLDDLVEKQEQLEWRKTYNSAILDAAETLLNSGARNELNGAEIDRLLGLTWWYNNPTVYESAPMSSIVIGGDLSVISDPELLQALSEFQLLLGNMRNLSENDQRFHNDILVPFYIENANLTQIANATKHAPGHPDSPYVFPELLTPTPQDHSILITREEFRSLLVAKTDKLLDLAGLIPAYEEKLTESVALIRSELSH